MTLVIDNLGQTSAVIDRAIGSAGDRLAAVQSGLAARVDEFQHALGAIASQVATLGRISSATQSDAGALAGQLAQHAETLAAVGRDLTQQQRSLDLALEHRKSSLQALIGDLAGRSEAFEATLGRFAANVEDSFARAQARAQEISATLASATRGASIAVAGQFETIRDTAAKERERTAQTLQATLEQTNAQLSGALDNAADRFRQSVGEVKEMASQVQRELDETRQELRRGVLDLPQETSETAEAMRRVVSDQIRALKELAALVADSGAAFDVAEPAPLAAATAARRWRALRQAPAARRARPTLRSLEAPSPRETALARVAEAIAPPVIEGPRAGLIGSIPEASPPLGRGPAQPWPAPPPAAAAAPAPASDRGQAGWLSNLLAAASRDEPAPPPRPSRRRRSTRWRWKSPASSTMRRRSRCGTGGDAATPPPSRAASTPRPASRRSTRSGAAIAPTRSSATRRRATCRSSSVCWRRSARTTATARNGAPISCPTPARSTRSWLTPRAGSGRREDALARPRGQTTSSGASAQAAGGVGLDLRRRMIDAESFGQFGRRAHGESRRRGGLRA